MLAHQGGAYDVVKVADFGPVKRLPEEDDPGRSDTRSIKGTPHYLSPEGVNTPHEVDARSDLYALDQLDIPRWTRAGAEAWWQHHRTEVENRRESITPRITGHTMEVVIDEPWFEAADGERCEA